MGGGHLWCGWSIEGGGGGVVGGKFLGQHIHE